MCGRETLAMLVSSTSMNVAIVTTRAMAQGLCPPVQPVAKYAGRSAERRAQRRAHAAARHRTVTSGSTRHAGAQAVEPRLARVELDAHGDALHHLHVVARRVLRREDAEARAGGAADALDRAVQVEVERVDVHRRRLARVHRRSSCVSRKFAVTHRSSICEMARSCWPGATRSPTAIAFRPTMPATGATILAYAEVQLGLAELRLRELEARLRAALHVACRVRAGAGRWP